MIVVGAAPAANRRLETAFAPAGAYMDASRFGKRYLRFGIEGLVAVLYPALWCRRLRLRALMEYAGEGLISYLSSRDERRAGLLPRGPTCAAITLVSTCATWNAAVSYTHLDVYKRQIYWCVRHRRQAKSSLP